MKDKGYAHPLYSLDLMRQASLLREPRYFLPVPEGRLCVRQEIRRRAATINCDTCDQAVCDALAEHALSLDDYADYGLTAAWAQNLRFWQGRMMQALGDRLGRDADVYLSGQQLRLAVARGRGLWQRLALLSRLAGGEPLLSGAAPRSPARLREALLQVAGRIQARGAEALSAYPAGARVLQDLHELTGALGALQQEAGGERLSRQLVSDRLQVMRAALIGDLSLFCEISRQVARPGRAMQMRRLLRR